MGRESSHGTSNITVITIKVHCIVVNVDSAVLMPLLLDTWNPSLLRWVELHTQSTFGGTTTVASLIMAR